MDLTTLFDKREILNQRINIKNDLFRTDYHDVIIFVCHNNTDFYISRFSYPTRTKSNCC